MRITVVLDKGPVAMRRGPMADRSSTVESVDDREGAEGFRGAVPSTSRDVHLESLDTGHAWIDTLSASSICCLVTVDASATVPRSRSYSTSPASSSDGTWLWYSWIQ